MEVVNEVEHCSELVPERSAAGQEEPEGIFQRFLEDVR